ncbi:MAG: hypothetical protein CM15mP59_4670 [Flavobacteriaceae bacterium]|nr:MAG: hypothetical protein CM15mP59_4670 [Flavobacteriaceae bacterium]
MPLKRSLTKTLQYTHVSSQGRRYFCRKLVWSCHQRGLQLKEHFGPDDVVVVLLHDSGSRYVTKIYNDDWMREKGFLEFEFKT